MPVSNHSPGASIAGAPGWLLGELHPELEPGPFDLRVLLQHEPPQDWKPTNTGDTLVGVVYRIYQGSRDDYTFPIMELIDADGLIWRVRCSAVSLKSQIEVVIAGDIVALVFEGKHLSRAGREYGKYTVRKH